MIYTNFNHNYIYDPQRYLNFSSYLHDLSGTSIYIGLLPPETINKATFNVRLHVETPNSLHILDYEKENNLYDLILHLCPFTCHYLNERFSTNKYKPIFFPIEFKQYTDISRTIDVFYTGHPMPRLPIYNSIINQIYRKIGKDRYHSLCNDINNANGYYSKLDMLNKTKICIVHNVLSPVSTFPGFEKYRNDSLCKKHLPWHSNMADMVPQLKTRIFEGAMMRCVLLVYKDKYNIHEAYFKEHEDFLYWETEQELSQKIDMILANYEAYIPMAENAHIKVKTLYQPKNFIDRVLELKQGLIPQ
jgi:hypothetical protein